MKPRLLPASLALLLLASTLPAQAGTIYRCGNAQGNISIQDRPCAAGSKTQRIYRDAEPKPRARGRSGGGGSEAAGSAAASTASSSAGSSGVPVGLKNERNKGVICGLLQAEKLEAQEQIAGRQPPPPGEDPAVNLVKIERQRSRVACE